jgi:uncharacterized protein
MKNEFAAERLDVKAFAQTGARLASQDALQRHARLLAETQGAGADLPVDWAAQGELRPALGGPDQIWLHLQAKAALPLTCQRCLGPVTVELAVDRSFRFVADEDTAAALDDEVEEDVLALSKSFDLPALIEDELLMALPLVPRHGTCPIPVKLAAVDPAFEAESAAKPSPFAVLAGLQGNKPK